MDRRIYARLKETLTLVYFPHSSTCHKQFWIHVLFGFSRGPLLFQEGPLLFSSSFLHYLGCFLKSSPCHEQFWMLFSIEDIPYRGYFTYLKKRAYIWPLILFYFVARLFASIFILLCVQEEATLRSYQARRRIG